MRRAAASLLALILSCGAGACGDDGEGGGSEGASTTAAASTTAGGSTSDGSGDESSSTSAGTSGEDDAVWMLPYCYLVSPGKWLDPWEGEEAEVAALVNEVRATGTSCGANGEFAPAGPLSVSPRLTCAARAHSQDMSERGFFSHVNPDGEGPSDRIDKTGYAWTAVGENIAGGATSAADAVSGWLASDDHCANLMNPSYKEIGVGLYEGAGEYTYYWTQTFGTPK
ncbi:MAG: CAP domain-containing protein [Nannocystaceae bacterium]